MEQVGPASQNLGGSCLTTGDSMVPQGTAWLVQDRAPWLQPWKVLGEETTRAPDIPKLQTFPLLPGLINPSSRPHGSSISPSSLLLVHHLCMP